MLEMDENDGVKRFLRMTERFGKEMGEEWKETTDQSVEERDRFLEEKSDVKR
jgi:hypothetical protein